VGFFILSLCVIFAGFANNIMKISFDASDTTIRIEENASMVWPQYALLLTSLVLVSGCRTPCTRPLSMR
jgi:hydrogenase-4 component F